MNNSIKKKNFNQKFINSQAVFSSTSSDFVNSEFADIKQKGGSCSCANLFKAIEKNNLELILYILEENKCCFMCKNNDGNTALHLLIPFYKKNKDISNIVDELLSNKYCQNFINIQNKDNQTPILLAVMNGLDELAEKMENAGADPTIVDIYGNYVAEKDEDYDTDRNIDMSELERDLESERFIKHNIMNIFNFVSSKNKNQDLTSLNLNSLENEDEDEDEEKNLNNNMHEDSDNFMKIIKSKINSVIKNKDKDSSSTTTTTTIEYDGKKNDNLQQSSDTLNSEKFLYLLGHNNVPEGVVKYNSDDENTDQYIATLRNKWNSVSESENKKKKILNETSEMDDMLSENKINKLLNETTSDYLVDKKKSNKLISETSSDFEFIDDNKKKKLINETTSENFNSINEDINDTSTEQIVSDIKKYISETTSDENLNFLKSKYNVKKNQSHSDEDLNSSIIDTDALLKVIKKIQSNNIVESEQQVGGGKKSNKQIMSGHRKLIVESDNFNSYSNSKKLLSDDYNLLYNSDSEFGSKSKINELSRMMISQKEKIHSEVLEIIMGMLNKGLLTQSNKPIEATERNAKLIKAYIYRLISEKNPQMGGMDKILTFKTMSESEIIKMVKKMPELDELEKSIQEHLEQKKTNKKTLKVSDTSEAEIKKSSKKSSKK